jgi:hypothetical protein
MKNDHILHTYWLNVFTSIGWMYSQVLVECIHKYWLNVFTSIGWTYFRGLGLRFWFLTPLSTIFQFYPGSQFYWWRKPEYPEKTTKYFRCLWLIVIKSVRSVMNFCPKSKDCLPTNYIFLTSSQVITSIRWLCYCTVHVYIVIHFSDCVWSFEWKRIYGGFF